MPGMFGFMKNKDGQPAIELGKKYRDTIHGFEGIATCVSRYLTGCDRVMLESNKDGDLKEYWFDITRLEGVEIPEPEMKTGGPQPIAPNKPVSRR